MHIDLVNRHIPRQVVICHETKPGDKTDPGTRTKILVPLSAIIAHYHIVGFPPRILTEKTEVIND